MSVMCIMAFVKNLVNMRYTVERSTAAPATNRRRYTVWLQPVSMGMTRLKTTHLLRVNLFPVFPFPTPPPKPPCFTHSDSAIAETTTNPANCK